jgi:hypothetical protein
MIMLTVVDLASEILAAGSSWQISHWAAYRDPIVHLLILVVPKVFFKESIIKDSPKASPGARVTQVEITGGLHGQVLRVCRLFLLEARPIWYVENHFVIGDLRSFRTLFYSSIPLSYQRLIKSLTILHEHYDGSSALHDV